MQDAGCKTARLQGEQNMCAIATLVDVFSDIKTKAHEFCKLNKNRKNRRFRQSARKFKTIGDQFRKKKQ
jgi:hypothetical protein